MADFFKSNALAQYSLQLLRGEMINAIIAGRTSSATSLQDFILGKAKKPAGRSGTEIMHDALTGLMRSDVGMLKQASKNMQEGTRILEAGSSAIDLVNKKIKRMQEIVSILQNDPSQLAPLQVEYEDLSANIKSAVEGAQYNGIKLLDGTDWATDERITVGSNGETGKLGLQSGTAQSSLTLYNLADFKTAFDVSDLTSLSATGIRLGEYNKMLSTMSDSYTARSKLFTQEADALKRQADILAEAAKRSSPNNEEEFKSALLDLLLKNNGTVLEEKS